MPDPFDELVSLGDDQAPAQVPEPQPSTSVTFPVGTPPELTSQPGPGQSATAQALRDDGTIDQFVNDQRQAQQDGATPAFVIWARDGAQDAADQWQAQANREKALERFIIRCENRWSTPIRRIGTL